MAKVDKKGLVWGLLLSVVVNGLYETVKSLMEGNTYEETIVFVATCFVAVVVMIAFWKLLFTEEK
jgi:hypothetical protein